MADRAKLRKLENDFKVITTMGPVSSFFKIEKDPFYKEGVEKGIEKGELKKAIEFARKLLTKKYTVKEIAELTGLSSAQIKQL